MKPCIRLPSLLGRTRDRPSAERNKQPILEVLTRLLLPRGLVLEIGGVLVTYGPYMRGGAHTSQSNEAFDASLRARNPLWGVRDIDKVVEVAGNEGLALEEAVPMPANNLTLVWRKSNGAFPGAQAVVR